jgi:phage terminase large subunit
MSLRPNDIKRAAETYIARASAAATATCAVLWQKQTEPDDVFAARVAAARTRLQAAQLLVVVSGFDVVPRSRGICVVEIPPVMLGLFDGPARYRVCYGGRGAGRSWSFARALIARSLQSRTRILCAREFQNSIADSIHTLLSDQIELLGLQNFFEVQNTTIIRRNGTEFVFAGLRTNVSRIKSLEGAGLVYIEEAANISANSWETLIPTIRAAGSEIWCAFNPDLDSDPTYQRFVVHPPESAVVLKTTFADNPKFPEPLRAEMEYLKRVDMDAYTHVWEGGCVAHSTAQIFRGKYVVESFEPQAGWSGPYYGADWGFSQDPTTLVKTWINDRVLYIEHEAYGVGIDIDRTPALFDVVPGARNSTIRADSARPETISYMQRHGYGNMTSVAKWSGSIEDGIAHMRSYERIQIHARCVHAAEEFRLYSFKVDRLSGDVQPEPVDRHNHTIDALRYALQPLIKQGGPDGLLDFYKQQETIELQKTKDMTKMPGVGSN